MRATQGLEEFEEFYAVHYPRLAAELGLFCLSRGDGEDAAQESFVRLLERWNRVSTYDDPVAWVRHVGYNIARDRTRKRGAEETKATRWFQLVGKFTNTPRADSHPVLDRHDPLIEALKLLPLNQREVLLLEVIEDLTNQQIAERLDVPLGTVKSRLSRARASLANHLEGVSHDRPI